MERNTKIALACIALMVLGAIAATAWHFMLKKDYVFTVEASCDPSHDTCFYRDCSIEDECPPNNLETYKVYTISAKDFPDCSDNSCASVCSADSAKCEEILCGESEEDICVHEGSLEE